MEPEEYGTMIAIHLPHLYSPTYVLKLFSPIPSPPPLSLITSASEPSTRILLVFLTVLPRCVMLLLQASCLFVCLFVHAFYFLKRNFVVFESAGNLKPQTLPGACILFSFVGYSNCFVCLWAIIIYCFVDGVCLPAF